MREMQRRGVDRDEAVQFAQAGHEGLHGCGRAGYKSWPHLFRKPGAQCLLKSRETIVLPQKHDFNIRALENELRQSRPMRIRPLKLGKPTPAAPRKKADSP